MSMSTTTSSFNNLQERQSEQLASYHARTFPISRQRDVLLVCAVRVRAKNTSIFSESDYTFDVAECKSTSRNVLCPVYESVGVSRVSPLSHLLRRWMILNHHSALYQEVQDVYYEKFTDTNTMSTNNWKFHSVPYIAWIALLFLRDVTSVFKFITEIMINKNVKEQWTQIRSLRYSWSY